MDSMETTEAKAPQPTVPTPPPSTSTVPASSSSPAIASATETMPSFSSTPNPNPNPNPSQNSQSSTSLQQPQSQPQPPQQPAPPPQQQTNSLLQQQTNYQHSQTRSIGPTMNRLRLQPPYQHFPHLQSLTSSTTTSSPLMPPSSTTISTPPMQRGGIAVGVPVHQARPLPQQPITYSSFPTSSFNQPFTTTGLSRGSVNVSDPSTNTTNATTTVRPQMQGVQGMGMVGSHGSSSHLRSGGVSGHPQQRPVQQSIRSQSTSSSQSFASQKLQGHNLLRVSSMGSPGSPLPGTPQSSQNPSQQWMLAGQQGKQTHPSVSSPSYRSQMKPQSLQQRSHIPQQHHHPLSMSSHQQQMPSAQQQQQPSPLHQSQENYGQQYPPPRVPQSLPHPQQVTRGQGLGNQKSPSLTTVQPTSALSGPQNIAASADAGECGNQILTKRSIHELVSQIDPSERLDPEVEDILVEIADEFVDSITTFACSLAKHRKSTTLEARDVLLHLERNWNITLPGFGGDEIKIYKKPFAADIHKERLAAIKKSIVGVEAPNTKSSAGQAAGNLKGHAAKAPVIGSPKTSEVP